MPLDVSKLNTVDKKVPLWLWFILGFVCAVGIAFFMLFRSSRAPVKDELTQQQKDEIFSDIQEDNVKEAPAPDSSSEPLLPQK